MSSEYGEIVLAGGRMALQLRHHGGRDGVTGSCHQLLVDGAKACWSIAACSKGKRLSFFSLFIDPILVSFFNSNYQHEKFIINDFIDQAIAT